MTAAPPRYVTGGGEFAPADRHLYFAAGWAQRYPRHMLIPVDQLMSPAGETFLVELLDAGHAVLLDSGIFTLTNTHRKAAGISFYDALTLPPEDIPGYRKLRDRYVYLVSRYGTRLWGYVELDQGGRETKRRVRREFEQEGLRPIPVYHPLSDGWDYFDELAEQYDRVCWGNVSLSTQPVRVRMLHTMWERRRRYPDLWVHMLGLTPNEWCLSVPMDSGDSSSWLNPLRFPNVKIGHVALRRVGDLGPRFLYDQQAPPDSPTGRRTAQVVYSDAVQDANTVWQHVMARTDAMGLAAFPPRSQLEGPLEPARKDKKA